MNDSFMMMFDIISLGCGGYCLFTFMKLHMTRGALFPNSLLIPNGMTPKDCTDPKTYTKYIGPKLLILGIVTAAFGLINMANSYFDLFTLLVSEILTGVALATVIWYGVCSSKANKRFW